MPDLNLKLDRFTSAILAEATAETEQALAALTEKRTAAYSAADDQLLGEVYRYIHGEVARVKAETGRMVSRHMLDDKRSLYLRRDRISAEVFGLVRARLTDYAAGPDYPARLEGLCREALGTLGNPQRVRVFLRPLDMELGARLAAGLPQVEIQFLEGTFLLGGLIADAPELGRRADATFDSALADLSTHFAELFGLSLSGELNEGGSKA